MIISRPRNPDKFTERLRVATALKICLSEIGENRIFVQASFWALKISKETVGLGKTVLVRAGMPFIPYQTNQANLQEERI
jgi:hypothetical protein